MPSRADVRMFSNRAQVTRYLGYSSLKDFFPTMDIRPNPGCANPLCGTRQAEAAARAATPEARAAAAAAAEAAGRQEGTSAPAEGLQYSMPVRCRPFLIRSWTFALGSENGSRTVQPQRRVFASCQYARSIQCFLCQPFA